MPISTHGRVAGRPRRVRSLRRRSRSALIQLGVVAMRQDGIAAPAPTEPGILRDPNGHGPWADIEATRGGRRLGRIA